MNNKCLMNTKKGPSLNEAVEWKQAIWGPAVSNALDRASVLLPRGGRILEVGYNSGMMSSYMACRYGWKVTGYDIKDELKAKAEQTAKRYQLEDEVEFRVCSANNTLSIRGSYDAVFLKSVLYHIADLSDYREWLFWLRNVVRRGGVVIAVENGKGGWLDKSYRKVLKKVRWADFQLFSEQTEREFRNVFDKIDIQYFGRYSEFFVSYPKICKAIQRIENKYLPAKAEHCFIASIVAQTT